MGASGALVMALAKRRLSWALLRQAMDTTARLSAFVIFILIGARVFSLTFYGVNGHVWVEHLLTSLPGGQIGFLVFVKSASPRGLGVGSGRKRAPVSSRLRHFSEAAAWPYSAAAESLSGSLGEGAVGGDAVLASPSSSTAISASRIGLRRASPSTLRPNLSFT